MNRMRRPETPASSAFFVSYDDIPRANPLNLVNFVQKERNTFDITMKTGRLTVVLSGAPAIDVAWDD